MLDRRHFLRFCVASGTTGFPDRLKAAQGQTQGRIAFRLRETAGLRRFHYPVHAALPPKVRGTSMHYRLLRDGKEIPAQFRETSLASARPGVALDFSASPGPLEVEDYVVEFGPDLTSNSLPKRGLIASHEKAGFRVANPPFLTYDIPDDLAGLVSSIKTPELEFVATDSHGLFIQGRSNGAKTPVAFPRDAKEGVAGWTRQGPFAVGLRFQGVVNPSKGQGFRTTVDLSFVSSKSWIEASWTVEDPEDRIESLGVDLKMKVDGEPTLVDCGASSTVYSHLQDAESLTFTGHPPASTGNRHPRWAIEQGTRTGRKPFATAVPTDRPAEGWIHLMDHRRCSALAVADFGVVGIDRFLIEGTGRMELERSFSRAGQSANPSGRKSLKFWLHVVPMPVQIGAATSPQAMLAPLVVEWAE